MVANAGVIRVYGLLQEDEPAFQSRCHEHTTTTAHPSSNIAPVELVLLVENLNLSHHSHSDRTRNEARHRDGQDRTICAWRLARQPRQRVAAILETTTRAVSSCRMHCPGRQSCGSSWRPRAHHERVHGGHPGISRMKSLAQSSMVAWNRLRNRGAGEMLFKVSANPAKACFVFKHDWMLLSPV